MIEARDLEAIDIRDAWDETRARALQRGKEMIGRFFHKGYQWEVWRDGKWGDGKYRAQSVDGLQIKVIGKTYGDILREIDYSLWDRENVTTGDRQID